jgi:hypothetical protein
MREIRLRPALPGDMPTIISMIDEAAMWLRDKGTDQWAQPWPDRAARDERVLHGLERGDTWLAEDADGPAATVTYRPHPNPKLWSDLEQGDRAVYMDRLVVRRGWAGQEIGAKLIDWTGHRALLEWQAQWTRIDIWTTNYALHRYFMNQGFEFCRFCDDAEYPAAALFQRPAAGIHPTEYRQDAIDIEDREDAIGVTLVNGRLRMISIKPDGTAQFLDEYNQSHALLYVVSLQSVAWKSAVNELEELINSRDLRENQLQGFFERNPQFLLGDIYEEAHPHIVLQRANAGPLIPDFALKPHNPKALCDLLELKLPGAKLIVGNNNRRRLSAAVLDACAQLREYSDYFETPENRETILNTYRLRFFRPRMIVIIGKRGDYLATDIRKAESERPNLTITTYDDLIERARARSRVRIGEPWPYGHA